MFAEDYCTVVLQKTLSIKAGWRIPPTLTLATAAGSSGISIPQPPSRTARGIAGAAPDSNALATGVGEGGVEHDDGCYDGNHYKWRTLV